MLDSRTKQTIDNACDTLVGKVPSPQTQVDIITTALIYKFMDDMDLDGLELSDKRTFFVGDLEPYAFSTIVNTKGNQERMNLYLTGLEKVQTAKTVPELFRRIFKEAMIPFRDPTTFALFLKEINELKYDDSETLGDAFEYLLNKMATAKNAGQFRTPRNIIDFIVDVVKPTKDDTILDPACGTAGFLISAYKHITSDGKLTPDELKRITNSIVGMDIDPTMVKLSLVNLYLHRFEQPNIYEYDTLSNDTRWAERYDVILANPPFMTPKGGITPHKRFAINANRSEVLFVDYFMEHLTINGRAGFVVPEGIIFQTANAYKDLRKMMLNGYLYAVVSLPAGVFNPYSGVKTSILFFDRAFAKTNDNILFVRVDNDGFSLGAQRTPIKQNDLPEALKIINEYREGKDVSGYERAMVVSKERIAENNYDLTAAKYIEKETRECKYEMVKLGNICEIYQPQTIPQKDFVENGEYNVFGANGIIGKYNKYNHDSAEIAVACRGATCGVVNMTTPKSWITGNAMVVTPKNEKILKSYLFAVLQHTTMDSVISGAAQPQITRANMQNLQIPLPPLDVQKQIVDEIENKQSAINHAREIIKNLERERQYFACLLDGIDYQEVKLGDVADVMSGFAFKSDKLSNTKLPNMLPVIKIGNISMDGKLLLDSKTLQYYTYDETLSKYLIQSKDIIVAMTGATVGKTAVADTGDMLLNQRNAIVRPKNSVNNKFIAGVLTARSFYEWCQTNAGGGAQGNISPKQIQNYLIPLPSIDDQRRIVAKLEAEQEIIDANKRLIDLMQDKINQVINRIYKCDL